MRALQEGTAARVVGDAGGEFAIVVELESGPQTIGNSRMNGPRYYPSLNHAADWLSRVGVNSFRVDTGNWRRDDTGRSPGASRP